VSWLLSFGSFKTGWKDGRGKEDKDKGGRTRERGLLQLKSQIISEASLGGVNENNMGFQLN
jgi:hypothetical protein